MKKKKQLLYSILFVLCLQTSISAQIYVDQNANGNNDGTSWVNAFTDLQPALDVAQEGEQVWVTVGVYLPTKSPSSGVFFITRDRAFHFNTNIKLYGGFKGSETAINQRSLGFTTTLSGDLGVTNDITDNAYHVLVTTNLNNTALIDGFTITRGNADASSQNETITYEGKSIYKNSGGGMYNDDSSPTISNTTISNNRAEYNGGGMYNNNSSSSLTITNVSFMTNQAKNNGGGIYSSDSSLIIENSIFITNQAQSNGGGVYNEETSLTIANSIFTNNITGANGGGIANVESSLTIINTNFINNTATNNGGGMYNSFSSPVITNTVFWKNISDNEGDEIYNSSFSTPTGNNNASDGDVILFGVHIVPDIVVYLNDNNEPNFTDENNGDYTLLDNSLLINAGLNSANSTTLDLAGNARINCTIDIGAYENQDIIINPLNTEITKNVNTLTINTPEDVATYQWLTCSNNSTTLINGATNESFVATNTGSYAVQITTTGGCVFRSDCVDVVILTLNTEAIKLNNFTVYPNPSKDIFNLSFTSLFNNVNIIISDVNGRILGVKKYSNTNNIQLNIENEAAGIYFLRIQTIKGSKTIKLIKE